MFGTGARADLLTFFLIHAKSDFSASDLAEIGYSKRNLAEIMEELCLSKLFDKFLLRNQQRYRFIKSDPFKKILGPLPEYTPSWRMIFEILLPLRDRLRDIEKSSESTKVIEIRNFLMTFDKQLKRLNLPPPPLQNNFQTYLNSFSQWLIDAVSKLAHGNYSDKFFLTAISQ